MTESETTRWLSAQQQRSWRNYLGGVALLSERLDRDLRERHDVSLPEYEILVRLSEQDDHRLRMAELAHAVAHSRSRITHTVSRLEQAGLVERHSNASDGRGVDAVLTESGYRRLSEAAHTHVAGVREHFVDLASAEEFAALGDVMRRVADRLGGADF